MRTIAENYFALNMAGEVQVLGRKIQMIWNIFSNYLRTNPDVTNEDLALCNIPPKTEKTAPPHKSQPFPTQPTI
jgi:hypothetical protein